MKLLKPIAIAVLTFLAIGWCSAQASHTVQLTVQSPDTSSAAPGTATIQRASGACPATGVPASGTTLTSTLSVAGSATYSDSSVSGGNTYCYWASLKTQGGGSGVSNTFQGAITVTVSISGVVQ